MLSTKTRDAWFSTREKSIVKEAESWIDMYFASVDIESLVEEVLNKKGGDKDG